MRMLTTVLVLLLVACTPGEPETHTTTANVDLASIPALLDAIDGMTDNDLPVDELLALSNSVPMDQEKQQRMDVTYGGAETTMLIHVWREQEDWVHFYASSTSKDLVDAVGDTLKQFERGAD